MSLVAMCAGNPFERIEGLIGASPPMRAVREAILTLASSLDTVLVTGESGTGKGVVAAALHQHGDRARGPFVKLHCAARGEAALERELFGRRLHEAAGGTLFLDEIGALPAATQLKLLRLLQDLELERTGSKPPLSGDVRIVAATTRVRAGALREDLLARLSEATIELPPLRQRPSDIPLLAARFTDRALDDEALRRLLRHPWPGNVGELRDVLEHAASHAAGDTIRASDLPPGIGFALGRSCDLPVVPGARLAEIERWAIVKTLEHTGGSTTRTAEILGISVRKIQYRVQTYNRNLKTRMP